MSFVYKFRKVKLDSGAYISRPLIPVILSGIKDSLEIFALVDSGSDITVIPEGIADAIGLRKQGKKDKLYAYREENDVIESKADIKFEDRTFRHKKQLNSVPVLIALTKEGFEEESEIVLGTHGVFDAFDINFKKKQNKILLKPVQ